MFKAFVYVFKAFEYRRCAMKNRRWSDVFLFLPLSAIGLSRFLKVRLVYSNVSLPAYR